VRKWRRKLHDWDINPKESKSPDQASPNLQVSGEEGVSPKNVLSQRQGTGLPLTLTGLRPAERTKRSNSATFMEVLLSPTNLPPQKMLRKKGQELPSNALMAKWREPEKENIPVNSIDAEIDAAMASYVEEVSYSDHDDHEMELIAV